MRPATESDIVKAALTAEDMFASMSVTAHTTATLRRLAALKPKTLAIMHGSSFSGDGGAALEALARGLDERRARPG